MFLVFIISLLFIQLNLANFILIVCYLIGLLLFYAFRFIFKVSVVFLQFIFQLRSGCPAVFHHLIPLLVLSLSCFYFPLISSTGFLYYFHLSHYLNSLVYFFFQMVLYVTTSVICCHFLIFVLQWFDINQ